MPLDQLWATWRSTYVTGAAEDRRRAPHESEIVPIDDGRSLFERILHSGEPDEETLIVHRGDNCFVILNRFPYTSGHLMVLPNRAVSQLEDLSDEEYFELWSIVRTAVSALRTTMRCDGVNVGVNLGRAAGGSQNDHVHIHCVPRWIGDANFMGVVGGSQVMPVALIENWRMLKAAWPGEKQPDGPHDRQPDGPHANQPEGVGANDV